MSKLNISVEKDHLIGLTRANGKNAVKELIWNSLDADATSISIKTERDGIGIRSIIIEDNGHGINFNDADRIFGRIGGSIKKEDRYSPGKRVYHGKEGKGRFKAFSLGADILFESRYKANGSIKGFDVKWNLNDLNSPLVDDSPSSIDGKGKHPGVKVVINDIDQDNASILTSWDFRSDLEAEYCVYHNQYKSFDIFLDDYKLQFRNSIRSQKQTTIKNIDHQNFEVTIIEWKSEIEKQVYYCGIDAVPRLSQPLFVRSSIPVSIYISSQHISDLHSRNSLTLNEFDTTLSKVIVEVKDFAKDFIRERIHFYNRAFIDELKKEEIYPYKNAPTNSVEEVERQVFDLVAVTINNHLTDFTEQDKQTKFLAFTLLQKALESDKTGGTVRKIITEVVKLPKDKQEDLLEILESTSLSQMIDAFKEITNRITIIEELKELIYNPDLNETVKERKHLHQIIKKEVWLFGDQYRYGIDDSGLENVLKSYIKHLGREELIEFKPKKKGKTLIPDICLFFENNNGDPGSYKNLIIELKKPTVKIGQKEIGQIQTYATAIHNDGRYPKEKTVWIFYLMATEINPDVELSRNQNNREKGLVLDSDSIKIYVKTWGEILNEARARHQYIRDKLNIKIADSQNLTLIREKYREVIPDELK